MKKSGVIVLLIGLLAGYWIFLRKGPFDKVIDFDSERFELAKSVTIGAAQNYYYTLQGEPFEKADEFIQLIVFDDQVPPESRRSVWGQLRGHYGLKPLNGDEEAFFGTIERRGIRLASYGARIEIANGWAYLVYLYNRGQEIDETEARRDAPALLADLRKLQDFFAH